MKAQVERSLKAKAPERRALWRAAATLERASDRGKRRRRAPTVFFFTDPERTPDPAKIMGRLPPGTGVIFRSFGAPGSEALARSLLAAAKRRRLLFLIGADERLAFRIGAMGLHLPERALRSGRGLRRRHPRWVITGAAHSLAAVREAKRQNLDAVFVSAVFPSRSRSAGAPMGPLRLFAWSRTAGIRPHALGGVDGRTAPRLIGGPVSGFAAVEGLL